MIVVHCTRRYSTVRYSVQYSTVQDSIERDRSEHEMPVLRTVRYSVQDSRYSVQDSTVQRTAKYRTDETSRNIKCQCTGQSGTVHRPVR